MRRHHLRRKADKNTDARKQSPAQQPSKAGASRRRRRARTGRCRSRDGSISSGESGKDLLFIIICDIKEEAARDQCRPAARRSVTGRPPP
jgi:hypothetical protein